MQLGDNLGFAGLIVALVGIAVTLLWPAARWIGYACLGVALILGIAWGILAYRTHEAPLPTATITIDPPQKTDREFTSKTPKDLEKFYQSGLTELQADTLMKPFMGKWIHASGNIELLSSDGGDGATLMLISENNTDLQTQCHFQEHVKELGQYAMGDKMSVIGKIVFHSNILLGLEECELDNK